VKFSRSPGFSAIQDKKGAIRDKNGDPRGRNVTMQSEAIGVLSATECAVSQEPLPAG
jgi:hypothetical protein